MLHWDIKQIKQAEAPALASIVHAGLEGKQIMARAWERSVRLIQERKQAAQAGSPVIYTEGNTR